MGIFYSKMIQFYERAYDLTIRESYYNMQYIIESNLLVVQHTVDIYYHLTLIRYSLLFIAHYKMDNIEFMTIKKK